MKQLIGRAVDCCIIPAGSGESNKLITVYAWTVNINTQSVHCYTIIANTIIDSSSFRYSFKVFQLSAYLACSLTIFVNL